MGLISSQIREANGKKIIAWPLQDNTNLRQMNELSDLREKNFEKLFSYEEKELRKQFAWKRIAKFWVSM